MNASDPEDARRARALLALLCVVYLGLAVAWVPRLTNTVMSDVDLSGWTTRVAARLAVGERAYDDFALPISPGAPLLLAGVQRLQGRALILQELWVVALCRLGLALLAYAIFAKLTSRTNAVFTAVATLAVLVSVPADVAWTSLAQLCSWGSFALGARALLADDVRLARAWWFRTGFVAGLALGFHQLVAGGTLLGWFLAFSYRAVVRRSEHDARGSRLGVGPFATGVACASASILLLAVGAGSSLSSLFRNVFGDAIVLAGSWRGLAENLATMLALEHEAYPSSLVLTSVAIAVGAAAARRAGLALGDETARAAPLDTRSAVVIALVATAGFGGALLLLATSSSPLPLLLSGIFAAFVALPAFGALFGGAFFLANWFERRSSAARARPAAQAFDALFLAVLAASAVSGLAFRVDPESHYVEHPSLALGFACLFIAFERAGLGWLRSVALIASLATVYGPKLNRALIAVTPAPQAGAWAGLRVSYRGEELLRAAERVRALAARHETVLVLPEDAQLALLLGRPRPRLRGALIFVHTYPRRLVAEDIATLRAQPPKVIVIHPRRDAEWRKLFSSWAEPSGAEELTAHVLSRLLPERYRLDSTFRTVGFEDMGQLDIWVRSDAQRGGEQE